MCVHSANLLTLVKALIWSKWLLGCRGASIAVVSVALKPRAIKRRQEALYACTTWRHHTIAISFPYYNFRTQKWKYESKNCRWSKINMDLTQCKNIKIRKDHAHCAQPWKNWWYNWRKLVRLCLPVDFSNVPFKVVKLYKYFKNSITAVSQRKRS